MNCLLPLALFFTSALAFAAEPPPKLPDVPEDGCPDARIADYLRRHGDLGVIDPNVMLERTRTFQQEITPLAIGGSVWTSIGPTNGAGRATAVALHPTTAGTGIIGAAGGGAWRTTDFGATWTALTETIPNLSVGAIAYAPSAPNVVYLGTGEGGSAGDSIPGIGLLTSADGGANWTLPASVLATQFFRLLVDPANPNTLVAATNSGAYRSTGGQNGPWTLVIRGPSQGVNHGFGDIADMVRDPSAPSTLYATTYDRAAWCAHNTCGDPYNFVAPTVLKSADGGATWSPAANGLPVSTAKLRVGRMGMAIAPSAPQTLYVCFTIYDPDTTDEVAHIFKTVDGGGNWSETNLAGNTDLNHYFGKQSWYDNTIVVAPNNPNIVLAGGVSYVKTTDGGTTWTAPSMKSVHTDAHDLRYDSTGLLWIANDGGIWTTADHGNSAVERNTGLVTRQYYTVANDPANRNRVFGGMQDNGTNRRPDAGGTVWDGFSGADGFAVEVSRFASPVVFSTYQYAKVLRSSNAGAAGPVITNRTAPFGSEVAPFYSIIKGDPSIPGTLYAATYRLWKTTDGAESWAPLPTTTTDGSIWKTTSVVVALAISPSNPRILMVAQGGGIFRSTNGGATWVRTVNGLPNKSILDLDIDPLDPARAYAALAGTTGTSVYMTTDGGSSWSPRGNGLPSFSAQCVRVDPTDSQTLYCGTDVGVYRSTDGGANWTRFGTGMPAVSVYDLQALPDGSIVRAATHGRGIWELGVTGVTNHPPVAAILTPGASQTIPRGTSLTFTGSYSDADGDASSWRWSFADNWAVTAGSTVATHRFDRAGVIPVTFSVTDAHGAVGAATQFVTVTESGDACSNPILVPGDGPFPYTVSVNTEAGTAQSSDPVTPCYPYSAQSSIWLSFTPAASGTYDFSFCGSRQSAEMVGLTGGACGSYTPVAALCLRQTSDPTDCADRSTTATLTAGTTYRLMLTNYYYNDLGPISLTITRNAAYTPTLNTVSPISGSSAGGTRIVITGRSFADGVAVMVGGTPATNVQVLTPTVITAVTPPHAVGTVNVTVGTGTLGATFTYTPAGIVHAVRH